jgi:putative PIN family toxin of toxin-antitoxin system
MTKNIKINIVIDVNLWVSFAIGQGIKTRFENLLSDSRFRILSSNELYFELERVMNYPKIKKYLYKLQGFDLFRFLDLFNKSVHNIEIRTIVNDSPDKNDNYLLALSYDGKADCLITGDKPHLLKLNSYKGTQIIMFSDFCTKFDL